MAPEPEAGTLPPLGGSLATARAALRAAQARWADAMPAASSEGTLAEALRVAGDREAGYADEGEYVRAGGFRYPRETEHERWERTRGIIERVAPGPDEDPRFLEVLARQAASVEIGLRGGGSPVAAELLERIVIGTTGEPRSEGFAREVGGGVMIVVSAGMIDLLHQVAEAIALAWPIVEDEGPGVGFRSAPDAVAAKLEEDPYPRDLLHDALATWLYEGFPRASRSSLPRPEYRSPIQVLVNGAERFVVAHEYGHALMDQLAPLQGGGEEADAWGRELRADAFAAVFVANTSAELDLLPANMALQGAIVAMKAHEVVDRALALAAGAPEPDPKEGSESHPPFALRISQLERIYSRSHADPEEAREDMRGMLGPGLTLEQLWGDVAPRLRAEHHGGRALHPIWVR